MQSTPVGAMLREWRELRRFSQLQLSIRCEVSAKHLSYVETGRSQPSHEMIVHLCDHLEVPLRGRNAMLLAAGYAPRYHDHGYPNTNPHLDSIIELVIESHHYPASVVDRSWNIVASNSASSVFTDCVAPHLLSPPSNLIRLSLHADGLAPLLVNFDEYAHHIIGRLRRAVKQQPEPTLVALLDEFAHLDTSKTESTSEVMMPLILNLEGNEIRLFSTITTFSNPREILLSELSIETFYPADPNSRTLLDAAIARITGRQSL
jgi:transcriptional regulator with XRE-family HTH domain